MSDTAQSTWPWPGTVSRRKGCNGLEKLRLEHRCGCHAEIYRHGGHLTAWADPAGNDLLFLSRNAVFAPGQPIRGGIPVVFPQFCDLGPLPKHGFVRTRDWRLLRAGFNAEGEAEVVLQQQEDATTLALWPHRFSLELTVALGPKLTLQLQVANTGCTPFDFTLALHTYFAVADITRTTVTNLQGTDFIDTLLEDRRERETRTEIPFTGETDRIYLNAPEVIRFHDHAARRTIHIMQQGMPDAVLWNPWREKSRRLPDFAEDEFRQMLCVETGCIGTPVNLAPGARWQGATTFLATAMPF